MTYRAHVRNGRVELDEPTTLPEGSALELRLVAPADTNGNGHDANESTVEAPGTLDEQIDRIWADVPDSEWDKLPPDLLDQLDHYIYGTPKQ